MIFSIFLFLLLGCFNFVASDEKCPYKLTVDLTNQHRLDNGSYVYQDILIPPEKQDYYDYHETSQKTVSVPRHLRGCVCTSQKSCIKLCCDTGEFYNTSSYKCEKLPEEVTWNLAIQLKNQKVKIVDVFEQFIYQVGVPCKRNKPLIRDVDYWILLENGELLVYVGDDKHHLDTQEYCFTPHKFNNVKKYLLIPLNCLIETDQFWLSFINAFARAMSVLFLIPTVLVYLVLKELRRNLSGKLLICHLLSSIIADGINSFMTFSGTDIGYISCNLLGYIGHFFFMAAFIWLNVLCYDMWINFKAINVDDNLRENRKRFLCYSLHAWGWSTIITLLTMWAVTSTIDIIPNSGGVCLVHVVIWTAAILFYSPILIIIIINCLAFAYLTVYIYKVRRDSANISRKERFFRENAIVILRLFTIMGVSWIFDIMLYYLPDAYDWKFLYLLSILVNALRGVLIFKLFVLKPNVLNLLKNRFNTIKAAPHRSGLPLTTNTSNQPSNENLT